jgi:hypothetical protein
MEVFMGVIFAHIPIGSASGIESCFAIATGKQVFFLITFPGYGTTTFFHYDEM